MNVTGSRHSAPFPWRFAILVLSTVTCLALSVTVGRPMSDWSIAAGAGNLMLDGRLDVYALRPGAQMGPLALLLAAIVPKGIYAPVVGLLLPVFLVLVMSAARSTAGPTALVGALLLAWPWAALGVQGHGDDAIVLTGLALALFAHTNRMPWVVAAGFVIAIAAKPLAVVFLPLLLLHSRKSILVGLGGTALVWLPFFLADPTGFLRAGEGQSDVLAGSLFALLGVEPMSGFPGWVRPLQLIVCLTVCWWLARRGNWAYAILAVYSIRVLLEPAPWNYYSTSVLAAAVMVELVQRQRFPILSGLAFSTFVMSRAYFEPLPTELGLLRIGALSALIAAAVYYSRATTGTDSGASPPTVPAAGVSTSRPA